MGLRQSMSWLHGWLGLLLGWLCYAIFLTGTTAYFRQEITSWMQPEAVPSAAVTTEEAARVALAKLESLAPRASQWRVELPDERRDELRIAWQMAGESGRGGPPNRAEGTGAPNAQPRPRGDDHGEAMPEPARSNHSRAQTGETSPDRAGMADTPSGARAAGAAPGAPAAAGRRGGRRGGQQMTLDPASGEIVKPRETAGGDFLNDFHYELHAMPREWARRIVGIAAMAMFIALISGIITHKKIFTDFFTFRPGKGQRSWLDFHDVSSVLALPFHLMITYTGVMLVAATLLPLGDSNFGGRQERPQAQERQTQQERRGRGETVALAPVGPMIAFAEQKWGDPVSRLTVNNPGRPDARVELQAAYNSSLLQSGHHGSSRSLSFSGAGEYLTEAEGRSSGAISGAHSLLGGFHRALFAEPILRWLFFLSGIGGSVMIATGLVLWSLKRTEKRKGAPGHFGHHLVGVLNIGTVAGLLIAVAGYFWANRLLPVDLADRASWEIRCFFLAWLAAFIHPLLRRPRQAWIEQLTAAGLLLASIPVLNFATTRAASLAVTLPSGNWIVAGFDLTTCVIGVALLHAAWKVGHHQGRGPRQANGQPVPVSNPVTEKTE
jgi:uncharacterized iron-regulated membrane protein